MGAPGAREIALKCYNNAYYVCTLILLEANDFPELRISDYVDKILEIEKENKHVDEVCLASMAMASLLLAKYDEEKYGTNSEIWKAIYYRCTHYQWYHSSATAIFLDMISLQYRFTNPLSDTEFAPRDIIEVIETISELDLQVYAEYICERLDLLNDLRQRVHGADTAMTRIEDYQRELCEDSGYNPKKDCFKFADNDCYIRDLTWEINVRGEYKKSKAAIDYYQEHYPTKEENNSKEETITTPQTPEVNAQQRPYCALSGDLDEEKAKMQTDTENIFSDSAKAINGGIPYALQDDPQKRIEELLKENKSLKNRISMLEEKITAEEAKLLSGFDGVYVLEEYDFDGDERKNVKRKILDTDKTRALAAAQKDNKEYQKQLSEMEKTVNTLRDKLGNHSVLLSVLASGIKEFAEEKNIEEAHTLFEHLCYILLHVPAWTKNAPELKKFFKKARKETQKASLPPIDNHGQVVIQTGKEAEASYNPKKNKTE